MIPAIRTTRETDKLPLDRLIASTGSALTGKRRVLTLLSSSSSQTKYIRPGPPENAARYATDVLSMKLGVICIKVPGLLNTMTAQARHLQARNHDVVFLYSSGAAGLPFVPGPEKDHVNESILEVSRMQGEDALQFAVRNVLAQTETILNSLPAVVQANGIDALLIDTVQFYAELGAMQLGMPYIHVSNALHFDFSGYTPLCMYDWPCESTPEALARNREGVANFAKILENANAGIRAFAEKAGLKIDWETPHSTLS